MSTTQNPSEQQKKPESGLSDVTNVSSEDKSKISKLTEKGQDMFNKAKDAITGLTSKISGPSEIKEEDKVLKREDELTDLSQMSKFPTDQTRLEKLVDKGHDLLNAAKESLSHLTSKPTVQGGDVKDVKEQVSDKVEQAKDIVQPQEMTSGDVKQQVSDKIDQAKDVVKPEGQGQDKEKHSLIDRAREEVKEFAHNISQKVKDYRDSGDLSSETTIQPNREGPSPLDKINDQYGKTADKISDKVSEVKDKVMPSGETFEVKDKPEDFAQGQPQEGKSLLGGVKEQVLNISSKISDKVEGIKEKLRPESDKALYSQSDEKNQPAEGTKDFIEVKEGFYTEVQDLDKDQREEIRKEMHKNPFEALADENINIAQPLAHNEVVGGHIQEFTADDAKNIDVSKLSEGTVTENKSLLEKAKEGVENVSTSISSTISEKLSDTKEKIKSMIPGKGTENQPGAVQNDKENAPQQFV